MKNHLPQEQEGFFSVALDNVVGSDEALYFHLFSIQHFIEEEKRNLPGEPRCEGHQNVPGRKRVS